MLVSKIIFLLFFSISFAEAKIEPPKKINGAPILGSQIMSLLRSKHSDFKELSYLSFTPKIQRLTNNSPSIIIGNFNGDGIDDAAVYGYSKKERKFFTYAAISSKAAQSYQLKLINQRPFEEDQKTLGFTTYLRLGRNPQAKAGDRDTINIETFDPKIYNVLPYYYSIKENKINFFRGTFD